MDPRRYPPDWKAISLAVRERAGRRCECRGECGHDHTTDPELWDGDIVYGAETRCNASNGLPHPITQSRVVLTVAHLWRGPCSAHHAMDHKCGDPDHLKAMCQRCHLAYDLEHHVATRTRARHARRAIADLFDATP